MAMRAWGIHKGVALARGSATLNSPLMPISLVTFLFGHKKVTLPPCSTTSRFYESLRRNRTAGPCRKYKI